MLAVLLAGGCADPIARRGEEDLRRAVLESLKQETAPFADRTGPRTTTRSATTNDLEIRPEHLDEIEQFYNPARYPGGPQGGGSERIADLAGQDLLGQRASTVTIGLRRVVRTALEHNLSAQEASLGPAIAEAGVVAAESAFDWIFYSNLIWSDTDTPQAGPGFIPGLQRSVNAQQTVTSDTGLRRSLITGGSFSVSNEAVYTDVRSSGFGSLPVPNPSASAALTFQIDQPLLRGFGSDVGLAEVRLARNSERAQIAALKARLITVVTQAESAYWDLLLAHRELVIASRLLERGEQVREDIKARRVLDAVQAQVADAVARVERRKGDVLRAQRAVRRASDRLKVVMNDPAIPVGSELLLVPSDEAIDEAMTFSLLDEIEAAVNKRPEIDAALLAIDDASIRQVVAQNGVLPALGLRAQAALLGFDANMGDAYGEIGRGELIDNFLIGGFFEQAIGNRGPEAELRRRRLERMRSVIAYRRTVQEVVLEVKEALDEVVTNYQLIAQAQTGRIAAAEALRTLLVEKELTDRGYTVERLNLELNQQDSLATAERAEILALVDYNTAIARLHAATGTTLERNRINFVVPDVNQLEHRERARVKR